MIITNITIEEGMLKKSFNFSNSANLIHSTKNSVGKTTLVRFILYGLGYDIPSTRGIRFDQCKVDLNVILDSGISITLCRTSRKYIKLETKPKRRIYNYVLPDNYIELGKILYNTDNNDLVNNLLGSFYVDQDKGWTLLNRGKVIGNIEFHIEEFIRGISGIDCSDLITQKETLMRKRDRYKALLELANYRDQLVGRSDSSIAGINNEIVDESDLIDLEVQASMIAKKISRIDKTILNNKGVIDFINSMKLMVHAPSGETFQIISKDVIGLDDSIDILIARREILSTKLKELKSQIADLKSDIFHNLSNPVLFKTQDQIANVNNQIMNIPFDRDAIQSKFREIVKDIKSIEKDITIRSRQNSYITSCVAKDFLKYAKELGLDKNGELTPDYIFTSNLKELSGAELHKMAFAFRLAYVLAIKRKLNLVLPIILDSPKGREIDDSNIAVMMNILKRDFKNHQLIIASIFRYEMLCDDCNTIEIEEHLLKE